MKGKTFNFLSQHTVLYVKKAAAMPRSVQGSFITFKTSLLCWSRIPLCALLVYNLSMGPDDLSLLFRFAFYSEYAIFIDTLFSHKDTAAKVSENSFFTLVIHCDINASKFSFNNVLMRFVDVHART